MFEAEIESTKLRLAEQLLPPNSDGLYLVQVLDHPLLDYAYKQYFRAEIEWMLYQERIHRQANLPVDANDPVFRRVYGQFEEYVRTHARFDRKAATGLIDTAVKSILNYRLRPRVTLKWFVFRGEPTKPVCEILLRLRYFADYPYFVAGFEQWMEDRSLDEESMHIMPVFEFERLVKSLDDNYILDLSTTEFIELLDPIFRFFTDQNTPPAVQTIPIEALIVFLDDKDIQVIAQKLERMLYHDGVRSISREMILRVVDQVLQELEEQQEQHSEAQNSTSETANVAVLTDTEPTAEKTTQEEHPPRVLLQGAGPEKELSTVPPHPEPSGEPTQERQSVMQLTEEIEHGQQKQSDTQSPTEEEISTAVADVSKRHTTVDREDVRSPEESIALNMPNDTVAVPDTSESFNHDRDRTGELQHQTSTSSSQDISEHLQDSASADEATISSLEIMSGMVESFETAGEQFLAANQEDSLSIEREFGLPRSPSLAAQAHHPVSSAVAAPTLEGEHAVPADAGDATPAQTSPYDEILESGLQHVRVSGEQLRQSYTPLATMLNEQLKEAVLKKLCAQDTSRFEGLLARLDAASSIRTALNELDRYCTENGIDPKNKAAQELRMVLVKRYTLT